METQVREAKDMARTLKSQVGGSHGVKVQEDHALVPWMVRHAGMLLCLYRVDESGRTAYEWMFGTVWER